MDTVLLYRSDPTGFISFPAVKGWLHPWLWVGHQNIKREGDDQENQKKRQTKTSKNQKEPKNEKWRKERKNMENFTQTWFFENNEPMSNPETNVPVV